MVPLRDVPARSAEQYACPGDDLLTKARVGKRYRSNARTIYGRVRPSASGHDGKSYIRAGSDRAANGTTVTVLAGALAAAGVRVLRRCRERFALQGRRVLIAGAARGLGPNPRWHEHW